MTPTQVAAIDAIIADVKAIQANLAAYVRIVFVPAAERAVTDLVQKLEELKASAMNRRKILLLAMLTPLLWLTGGWINTAGFTGVYVRPRFLTLPMVQVGDFNGTAGIVLYLKDPGSNCYYHQMPPALCYQDGEVWIQKGD